VDGQDVIGVVVENGHEIGSLLAFVNPRLDELSGG